MEASPWLSPIDQFDSVIGNTSIKLSIFVNRGLIQDHVMQTIRIELTDNNSLKALQELEHKRLIRIVREPDLNSFTLPGEPVSEEDFRKWVEYAEGSPTVSLAEAKQRWATQNKKLQKLIR